MNHISYIKKGGLLIFLFINFGLIVYVLYPFSSELSKKDPSKYFLGEYQRINYPIVPQPINAKLTAKYKTYTVLQDVKDLSDYDRKYDKINILRLIYRNNTSKDIYISHIRLVFSGIPLKTPAARFMHIDMNNSKFQDMYFTKIPAKMEPGKPYVAELYLYAIQPGKAKIYAEIKTLEGLSVKTGSIDIRAE
jgi:hypothetical protein